MNKLFKLKENGTTVKTEIIAGITTFMTMAYIIAVNPSIFADAGMDKGAVFTATVGASIIATLVMAFFANMPLALAPGMGVNAFLSYTVILGMGYSWEVALSAVFVEGIIFLLLTLFNIRDALINSIPINMKRAISVGIGLFITFMGLKNAQIVVNSESSLVGIGNMMAPSPICAIFGVILIGVLLSKHVKGAILIGVIASSILGIPLGITKLSEYGSILPPSLSSIAFKLDFTKLLSPEVIIIVFICLFGDVFSTIGTVVGVCTKANMINEKGEIPRSKQIFLADAIGTIVGSLLGTSTVTTYVESTAGVAEGGRTGLTALTVAILFGISLFLSHIFLSIPAAATAPALIIVGLFMMTPILEIDFNDYTESIPAFMCITLTPLTSGIGNGITYSILSYTIIKLISGKYKDISIFTYVLSIILLINIILPKIKL